MRSAGNFPKWLVFVVLIIIAHFCDPFLCWPQTDVPNIPRVSLTIFLVPEKEACKPDGFRTYDGDKSTNCWPLTMVDIEKWVDSGISYQTVKIPPREISLNNLIFEILDSYRQTSKNIPEERLAAVFLFKWEAPQKSAISLERKGDENSSIPAMKWAGLLNNETFWIHQERADALLPAYDNRWILKTENKTLEFIFVRK